MRVPAALCSRSAGLTVGIACLLVTGAASIAATSEDTVATSVDPSGQLVFASAREGADLKLYTMKPDPKAAATLLAGGVIGVNPRWSPRGDRIAFVRDGDIWVVNADGGGSARNLTRSASVDINPSWSPDGTHLAFASNAAGNYEIYVMALDRARSPVRITTNKLLDKDPAWSPDGESIAFQRNGSILKMSARDGSGVKSLAGQGENVSPAWSPDGARIAFASKREPHRENSEIYVMSASNWKTTQRRLTVDRGKPFSDTDPTWSPDGREIVFTSTRGDNGYDIFIIKADGKSEATQLTTDPGQDTTADWWPDFTTSVAMRERVETGVLRIRSSGPCDAEDGTGFIVGDRLVVTANHVVRGATRIVLMQGSARVGDAKLVGRDKKQDVALLRASTTLFGFHFRLTPSRPAEDARVTVLGYREGGGRTRRETRIEATNETSIGEDGQSITGLIRLTEYLEPGNSGSPVLVSPLDEFGDVNADAGDVVGLVIRRGSTTFSLALPAGRFRAELARWKNAAAVPPEKC